MAPNTGGPSVRYGSNVNILAATILRRLSEFNKVGAKFVLEIRLSQRLVTAYGGSGGRSWCPAALCLFLNITVLVYSCTLAEKLVRLFFKTEDQN